MSHPRFTDHRPPADEVLDALNELFFVLDEEGRLIQWNRCVTELTGRTDEELKSMPLSELVPDDERVRLTESLRHVDSGCTLSLDIHLMRHDRRSVPFALRIVRNTEIDPPVLYARAHRTDGSACEEPPATLRGDHAMIERFRQVLSDLPVYVFVQDRDLKYRWVSNTSLVDDPGELVGKTDRDLLPRVEARRIEETKRRLLQEGTSERIEFQVTINGEQRWYDAYLAPTREDDGRITGIAGAALDITARRQAEQEQVASRKRYIELFEAARDGIAIHTPEGKILAINPAGLDMIGYSLEELEMLDQSDIFPYPDQVERGAQIMEEKGEIRNLEVTLQRRDGEEITCLLSSTAHTNDTGEAVRYFTLFRDITERKRYQDQFRLLVDEVEDYAIFILDMQGHVITWNEGAEKIKGYSRDEIIGEHLSLFYTEEDRSSGIPRQSLQTAMRKGRVENEGWRVRKDGSRFWARATLTALRDTQGRLRGFAKVTRDLTEDRRREEELRESEERYRRIFEESQEGIGISTPEGQGIDVNPAGQEILGYDKEELLQMNLQELYVDPVQRERGRKRLIEEGALRDFEVRIRRKDGQEIICQLSSTVRRGSDGEIEAFETFFRDITEQKRAQQALKESEEKFRTVAEKALVGIGLLRDGILQYVNPRYAEIFGYREDELIGRSPEIFIHPDDREYVQRQIERRLTGQTDSVRYQFRGLTREGDIRYLDVYGGRITYKDRPAVIATVMDITRQRRLEEQLLEIQEAERRRIGQELHDGIASQLTGVTMIGESLTAALKEGEQIQPSDLQEVTELMHEAVQQIRLLSRGLNPVQVGKEGLPVALRQLAERTERQSGLTCAFNMEGAAVDLDDQNAAHLYRIAQEAVNNAVKHAAAARIDIDLSSVGEALELTVKDDGTGLPETVAGDSEGLGLHTMRYRADLIGGRLEISRRSEGGTMVRCRLSRQ